jgi:hypothetical protein
VGRRRCRLQIDEPLLHRPAAAALLDAAARRTTEGPRWAAHSRPGASGPSSRVLCIHSARHKCAECVWVGCFTPRAKIQFMTKGGAVERSIIFLSACTKELARPPDTRLTAVDARGVRGTDGLS